MKNKEKVSTAVAASVGIDLTNFNKTAFAEDYGKWSGIDVELLTIAAAYADIGMENGEQYVVTLHGGETGVITIDEDWTVTTFNSYFFRTNERNDKLHPTMIKEYINFYDMLRGSNKELWIIASEWESE